MNTKSFADFFASKDKIVAYVLLGLLFCLITAMILFVGFSSVEKESLLMKTEAERSFNSIYMAWSENQDSTKATQIMSDESVIGIGIYSSTGRLYRYLGSVPYALPYGNMEFNSTQDGDASYGIYSFDRKTGVLRYMRLARLSIDLDAGALVLDESGSLSTDLDFPEILYVVMDGSSYSRAVTRIWLLTAIALAALVLVFLVFIRLFNNNRKYKEMLSRQESLVSLGAAARTLAHEIKNPLSAMTIQTALLKKELPPEYRSDLAVIDQEILRLTQLTNKVSDFLRNPLGDPALIEVRSFLEGIKNLFPNRIEFTPSSLKEAYIEFDPDRARSVFENLIKNATESCTGRDPQVQVDIVERRKSQLSISVLDRGDGLPKGDRSKFFDPFFTTKIHGSGIGLSITRQFLKARGGTVTLSEREGGGTKAEVVISMIPIKFAHAMLKIRAEDERKGSLT